MVHGGLMDVLYNILSKNVLQYLNEVIQPILSGVENKNPLKRVLPKQRAFVISSTLNLTGVTHKSRCSSLRSAASSNLI